VTIPDVKIVTDDLTGPEIAALLDEHLEEMRAVSPPESKHALDLEGLRAPDVTFWTVWDDTDGEELLGCGALRELDPSHGEIKSMRTASAHRGRGTATRLVERPGPPALRAPRLRAVRPVRRLPRGPPQRAPHAGPHVVRVASATIPATSVST
jgi:putative acetyltransferase